MKSRLTNGKFATTRVATLRASESQQSNSVMTAAVEQTKAAGAKLEQTIKSYPVASLAAAAVAGVLLGWWVKRK